MFRIKKDDQVIIITGKDKGKTGKVLRVLPREQTAVVENINIAKKVRRKTQQDPQGGFMEIEAPIHLSNLMLMDKKNNKSTRFGVSVLKDNSKIRISRKTKEEI